MSTPGVLFVGMVFGIFLMALAFVMILLHVRKLERALDDLQVEYDFLAGITREIVEDDPCKVVMGACYAHSQATLDGCPYSEARDLLGTEEPEGAIDV